MKSSKEVLHYFKSKKFIPSKKMGQNFLIDSNVVSKIIKLINESANGIDGILEIGPGLGALSNELSKTNKIYCAIEIDKRLAAFLVEENIINQESLVCDDALIVDWNQLFPNIDQLCLVGNLPYSISTVLIDKFIKTNKMKIAILMLQKEMANRISAKCGSSSYNGFSAFLQSVLDVKEKFIVHPNSFMPRPNIDSTVVVLVKRTGSENLLLEKFDAFLKISFAQRRKTLQNNLKGYYETEKILAMLKMFKHDVTTRAQELTPAELYQMMEFIND